MTDTDWLAPGPGEWTRLADHFDRPFTAEYERIFVATFERAWSACTSPVGLPVRTITLRTVHGYPFLHPAPLSGPDTVACRRRASSGCSLGSCPRTAGARVAADALRDRPWRDIAAATSRRSGAAAIAENEALTAIDPAGLSDADLAAHLEACEAHAIAGYRRHFELHATDMFPVGLYLAECGEFGIDVAVALDLVVDGIADVRAARDTPRLRAVHRRRLRPRPAPAVRVQRPRPRPSRT